MSQMSDLVRTERRASQVKCVPRVYYPYGGSGNFWSCSGRVSVLITLRNLPNVRFAMF